VSRTIVFAALVQICAFAQDSRQVVSEALKRSRANSQRYTGILQVVDSKGGIREKRWTYARLGAHGASKAVIRFTAPADVRGVALLIVNHPDRPSDQWMWTPAIGRDRRIAVQDRRTRFFGTDFTFEDLEERDIEQYDYGSAAEETLEGEACWKIPAKPKPGRGSQYTDLLLWVRKSNYTFAQAENYSKGKLIRRLKYKDVANVQGVWTAKTLEMHDLGRNSRTILKLESLEFNVPLKDEDFTLEALRRG
jgi:hypothetical protein